KKSVRLRKKEVHSFAEQFRVNITFADVMYCPNKLQEKFLLSPKLPDLLYGTGLKRTPTGHKNLGSDEDSTGYMTVCK
ncbi:hypothetical protein J6590_087623, partial [Homalodisca vitripennis]